MAAAEASTGGGLAAFVSGKNMKVFAAAVSAIAKIGKDLYLDASEDGVSCGVRCAAAAQAARDGEQPTERRPPASRASTARTPPLLQRVAACSLPAQMMLRALNGSNSVYLAVLFTRGECSRTRDYVVVLLVRIKRVSWRCSAMEGCGLCPWVANAGFFTHFEAPSVRDGSPSVRCKVQVKAMQPVLTGIRSVESTRIALAKSGVTSYIIFQHQCSSGAVKTHALMYEDTEVFAAVYDRAQASHK